MMDIETSRPGVTVRPDPFVEDNLRVLAQGLRLIASLDPQGYAGLHHAGASVGAHFRHVLDHYQCLREGLAAGVVDYDARHRDPRTEQDRDHASGVAREIVAWLLALDPLTLASPLGVRLHTGPDGADQAGVHPSSVRRELHFAMMHTVHHYACMGIDLKLRGVCCEPDFGVAPATLGYRRSTA